MDYLRLPDDLPVALRADLSLAAPRSSSTAVVLVPLLAEVGLELAEDDAVLHLAARRDVLEEVHVAVVVELQKERH